MGDWVKFLGTGSTGEKNWPILRKDSMVGSAISLPFLTVPHIKWSSWRLSGMTTQTHWPALSNQKWEQWTQILPLEILPPVSLEIKDILARFAKRWIFDRFVANSRLAMFLQSQAYDIIRGISKWIETPELESPRINQKITRYFYDLKNPSNLHRLASNSLCCSK